MRFSVFLLGLVFSLSAFGQVLFVSDVDDTIKLANVPNKLHAVKYAWDGESRFAGMSQLYNLIRKDNVDNIQVAYLSNAPTWLMKETHREFLINGNFPRGLYIGRTDDTSDIHKQMRLRELIEDENPQDVILIGDNSERDPQIYEQIRNEYERFGIRFHIFIRVITDQAVPQGQVKFVTPIEVSYELEKRGLLSTDSVEWMMSYVAPYIAAQKLDLSKGIVAFPYFIQCQTFTWQREWTERGQSQFPILQQMRMKIAIRCGN